MMFTGESMGTKNLLLRVGLALSIVCVAIGMTFAAPNSFGRAADRAAAASSSTQGAATLVALATTIVLLAIFAILFSYRPRPGGVRASQR
ncbi:MAG: hypothetical protein AUH39_00270 [Chloroflexi bacterium 13_1_40CM_67_9]|nr:MAG: hypothetical protein AUH39_00270 [Chloroflexi bacterium 13_1_40CM_67_9]